MNIKFFFFPGLLFSLFAVAPAAGQELQVVRKKKEFRRLVEADSLQGMVEVRGLVPTVVYDLRYATPNNFTGKKLYKSGKQTFLRLEAARALQVAAAELATEGHTVKIWDAYRPFAATKKMWDLVGDERYVANPAKGSGHNRGLAVDLTLQKEGKDVDMGTGFDNFSDSAHHGFRNLPDSVLQNRQRLRTVMEKHGFKALETEWWHYSYPNNRAYAVLDLSFRQLAH